MLQPGAHRVGVRVICVVDDEPATGKLQLVAPPGREHDVSRPERGKLQRETESDVCIERRQRVHRLVALGERQLQLDALPVDPESSSSGVELDVAWIEATHLDVIPCEVRIERECSGGNDRDPTRRQGRDRLGVCVRDPFDGSEKLEVLGADVRDDDDRRFGDSAERGYLAESSHAHLGDDDLRLRFEPKERQRQADLVV